MRTRMSDIDPFCCDWMKLLYPDADVVCEDIKTMPVPTQRRVHLFAGIGGWEEALQMVGWDDTPVWTGSCPCQPFSNAGRRGGVSDNRHLWPYMRDLLGQSKPTAVFGEQVASPLGRQWVEGVRSDLEDLGYSFAWTCLTAAGASASHARHRIYWGAYSGLQGLPRLSANGRVSVSAEASPTELSDPFTVFRGRVYGDSPPIRVVDGLPLVAHRRAIAAYGNSVVPQVAVAFIQCFTGACHDKTY